MHATGDNQLRVIAQVPVNDLPVIAVLSRQVVRKLVEHEVLLRASLQSSWHKILPSRQQCGDHQFQLLSQQLKHVIAAPKDSQRSLFVQHGPLQTDDHGSESTCFSGFGTACRTSDDLVRIHATEGSANRQAQVRVCLAVHEVGEEVATKFARHGYHRVVRCVPCAMDLVDDLLAKPCFLRKAIMVLIYPAEHVPSFLQRDEHSMRQGWLRAQRRRGT
mmetsp:Transcript_43510/g.70515  ORF Transcript_43510/g.70515 Transcript_43510/m.70515 type:complete len:218 (+) Transcript_43510:442-1095(+)